MFYIFVIQKHVVKNNPTDNNRAITLGELQIATSYTISKVLIIFAGNYEGENPRVQEFCSEVNNANKKWEDIIISNSHPSNTGLNNWVVKALAHYK